MLTGRIGAFAAVGVGTALVTATLSLLASASTAGAGPVRGGGRGGAEPGRDHTGRSVRRVPALVGGQAAGLARQLAAVPG